MTVYYLSSVDGDNASDGLSWANAFLTFKYAVETASAAASGPHILYVDSAHSESLAADTTITAAGDIRIVSVNRAGSDAPLAGAAVGVQTTNWTITIAGGYKVYCFGVTFKNGTNTNLAKYLILGSGAKSHHEFEECSFVLAGSAASLLKFGDTATQTGYVKLKGGTITFGNASHKISHTSAEVRLEDVVFAGTAPTSLLAGAYPSSQIITFTGCDLSGITGTLVGDTGNYSLDATFINCKVGSGVTFMAAQTTTPNLSSADVTAYNCASGDTHYSFYHGNAFGSTTAQTTIYATAGAQTASTGVGYQVVTTANCSYYTPYVGPWIAKPHTGTSAVTPSFEIVRSGSATAYQDDEVWGEWSYQGTSGYPLAVFVNDRMAPLGTAADQTTGALAAGDWTGENATSWFGKLAPASTITPAESGSIYGRVVVGEPSITVYYDPQIRLA